jgi:hypothetical protein
LVQRQGEAGRAQNGEAEARCISKSELDVLGLQLCRFAQQESLRATTDFAQRAFLAFLAIPDEDLWVNLNPSEPDRIVSEALGQTEVARIMLEADFQLKSDAGLLMQQDQFVVAEKEIMSSIARRAAGHSLLGPE